MVENKVNGQTANETNMTTPANNSPASGNAFAVKLDFTSVSIKELLAKPEVQEAFRHYIFVPDIVTVKKVRSAFENKETKIKTQKIEIMSGTTIEDAIAFELTLLDTELDPVEAINKKYCIIDYTFALEANMSAGKFSGYAAKGLKLMVTKLEKVKENKK